ncbi:MAG TPA: hypothetical protein VIK13_06800 [Candidatus Limnocylindrales bacterium]
MTSPMLTCHACRLPLDPGQALRVTPVSGYPPPAPFVVHRVQLVPGCIRAAGRVTDATIALYSREAADAFDREAGVGVRDVNVRAKREAAEIELAFVANLAARSPAAMNEKRRTPRT